LVLREYAFHLLAAAAVAAVIALLLFIGVAAPELYSDPILYFGSAVLQSYAALVAVPFTIWVIYMQSRYGTIVVRMFLRRVVLPFAIMAAMTVISALTIALAHTPYAAIAYHVEFAASMLLLPVLVTYILRLMTMDPLRVARFIERYSRTREEFIATSLHLLRLYIAESYPDTRAIDAILRRLASAVARDMPRLKPRPVLWLRFKDFLKSLVLEASYLPSRYSMRVLMKSFLTWLLASNRDKVARNFIRYYRMVAMKYIEEQLPSEAARDVLIEPVLGTLRELKDERLVPYALEQLRAFLKRVAHLGEAGEISLREVCRILDLVSLHMERLGEAVKLECPEAAALRRTVANLRKEFRCLPRTAAQPQQPQQVARQRGEEKAEQESGERAGSK